MRPKQWIKNLFLFAGLIFSQNLFNIHKDLLTLLGFAIFCGVSGCVYLINDIKDIEGDKIHPEKSSRPIPSGNLSKSTAALAAGIILIVCLPLAFYINFYLGIITITYLILNLGYSFYLKNIVILDVFIIATGFVLRVLAGASIVSVRPSHWLIICTLTISLFLGFCKRRHELIALEDNAVNHRTVLGKYSVYFLDQMIAIVTASTVMSYALYTVSKETIEKFGTPNLIYSIPFVFYGIFRYLYLVHQKETGSNPSEELLTDKPLAINVILWILCVITIIYT